MKAYLMKQTMTPKYVIGNLLTIYRYDKGCSS